MVRGSVTRSVFVNTQYKQNLHAVPIILPAQPFSTMHGEKQALTLSQFSCARNFPLINASNQLIYLYQNTKSAVTYTAFVGDFYEIALPEGSYTTVDAFITACNDKYSTIAIPNVCDTGKIVFSKAPNGNVRITVEPLNPTNYIDLFTFHIRANEMDATVPANIKDPMGTYSDSYLILGTNPSTSLKSENYKTTDTCFFRKFSGNNTVSFTDRIKFQTGTTDVYGSVQDFTTVTKLIYDANASNFATGSFFRLSTAQVGVTLTYRATQDSTASTSAGLTQVPVEFVRANPDTADKGALNQLDIENNGPYKDYTGQGTFEVLFVEPGATDATRGPSNYETVTQLQYSRTEIGDNAPVTGPFGDTGTGDQANWVVLFREVVDGPNIKTVPDFTSIQQLLWPKTWRSNAGETVPTTSNFKPGDIIEVTQGDVKVFYYSLDSETDFTSGSFYAPGVRFISSLPVDASHDSFKEENGAYIITIYSCTSTTCGFEEGDTITVTQGDVQIRYTALAGEVIADRYVVAPVQFLEVLPSDFTQLDVLETNNTNLSIDVERSVPSEREVTIVAPAQPSDDDGNNNSPYKVTFTGKYPPQLTSLDAIYIRMQGLELGNWSTPNLDYNAERTGRVIESQIFARVPIAGTQRINYTDNGNDNFQVFIKRSQIESLDIALCDGAGRNLFDVFRTQAQHGQFGAQFVFRYDLFESKQKHPDDKSMRKDLTQPPLFVKER